MAASTEGPISEDPGLRAPETETGAGTARKEEAAPEIQGRRKTACQPPARPSASPLPMQAGSYLLTSGPGWVKGSEAAWVEVAAAEGGCPWATTLSPAHRCHQEYKPLWLELPVKPDTWILTQKTPFTKGHSSAEL